jgi:hypothetical protein
MPTLHMEIYSSSTQFAFLPGSKYLGLYFSRSRNCREASVRLHDARQFDTPNGMGFLFLVTPDAFALLCDEIKPQIS